MREAGHHSGVGGGGSPLAQECAVPGFVGGGCRSRVAFAVDMFWWGVRWCGRGADVVCSGVL